MSAATEPPPGAGDSVETSSANRCTVIDISGAGGAKWYSMIFFAGSNGAPDAYEQPFHSLDIVYSYYPIEQMALKFRAQNLLDEQLEIEQGGVTVLEQSIGVVYKFDVSYKF